MKIVFCANAICNVGGIDKVTIVKANALSGIPGNEVFIMITDHYPERALCEPLSEKVKIIDLEVDYFKDEKYSFWGRIKDARTKGRLHKRRLTEELSKISPDIVIAVGQSEKYLLTQIKGSWKLIREFHFEKHYRRKSDKTLLDKIRTRLLELYEDYMILRKYDRVIVLTNEEKNRYWKGNERVVMIPNPITLTGQYSGIQQLAPPISRSDESGDVKPTKDKVVVSVGRLTHQKNYDMLVRSFVKVKDRHPDWRLEIYGDGSERRNLENLIVSLGLGGNVKLCGITRDVAGVFSRSSIYCMSSRFEGFPLVLLEAASCGLPLISTACPSGPKDFIQEGVNGYLVAIGDSDSMADRINYMIENPNIMAQMGDKAKDMSQNYTINNIIGKHMNLYSSLLSQGRIN